MLYFVKLSTLTHLLIPEDEVSFHLYKSGYFNTRNIIKVLDLEYVATINIVTLRVLSKSVLSPGCASFNINNFLTQTFLFS